jgi:hypothetical protein
VLAGGFQSICNSCLASGSASNGADVATINAEIVEFPVAHTAKLGDRLTILAPIVESACHIQDNPVSWAFEAQLPVLGASVASMTTM